ncbi:MAG: ABC transporter permease, partial [Ignavibacteriaceae bacterium]
KNYLKISLRNIFRNKTYSIINILGLSIGITCSILILLWVTDEFSYDHYHKNANNIYRIVGDDAVVGKMAISCGPLAEYMKNNFPDVVSATRYMPYEEGSSFKYKNKVLQIKNGAFADPDFFEMFSFSFLKGNPKTALSDLSKIVITESMAKRFFGKENPVDKTLLIDGQNPVVVSAVIKDLPANSQLQFNIQKFNTQIAGIMSKQIPGFNRKLLLQPLTDIHLNTDFYGDLSGLGDKKYIYIFFAIALFLVLIACINYINLSTARVFKRSKEVGLRKIMGSNRLQVIKQFFIESIMVVVASFIIAVALIEVFLSLFTGCLVRC